MRGKNTYVRLRRMLSYMFLASKYTLGLLQDLKYCVIFQKYYNVDVELVLIACKLKR